MEFETIEDHGKFGIEFSRIQGDGTRIAKDFVRELLKRIIRRSVKYYDETGDYPFIYRERQLHSVVCPSIADITSVFLMEHPLKRKPSGEEEYSGNVDYWISYDNYVFLIELKHSYFTYRNANKPRESINRKFMDAIRQLENIRKDVCRDLKGSYNALVKIALEAVIFRKGSKAQISKKEMGCPDYRRFLEKLIDNTDLRRKSNFRSLWVLDERLVESIEYRNSFEIYPAVAFIGRITSASL